MPVELISEEELRAALRPHRPDAEAFEAKVRERLETLSQEDQEDPLAGFSPLLRGAAALIPLQILAGGKASAALATKLVPATGVSKILGYVMFPAISLFVLLGASLFGVARIRRLNDQPGTNLTDEKEIVAATRDWWDDHRLGGMLVLVVTLILELIGQTWLLFSIYIISFGLLVYLISAFAKVGLGSRRVIGASAIMGLMMLGQGSFFATTGNRDIHFVDQHVIGAIFMAGSLIVMCCLVASGIKPPRAGKWVAWVSVVLMSVIAVPLIVWCLSPLLWPATPARIKSYVESPDNVPYNSYLWQQWEPVASWTIERGLDPDLSATRQTLAEKIQSTPEGTWPDQSVLSYAMRVGLVSRQDLDEPRWVELYEHFRKDLFSMRDLHKKIEQDRAQQAVNQERREREREEREAKRKVRDAERATRNPELAAKIAEHRAQQEEAAKAMVAKTRARQEETLKAAGIAPMPENAVRGPRVPPELQPIHSLQSTEWVLRAGVMRGDLTDEDRDFLASRLHATIEQCLAKGSGDMLAELLEGSRLLAVIGRPVDPAKYRTAVQEWLMEAQVTDGMTFQPSGGFQQYLNMEEKNPRPEPRTFSGRIGRWFGGLIGGRSGSISATVNAVGLMQIYGIPPEMDLNWVRSFLKPNWTVDLSGDKWVAAVTLDRLNRVPGAAPVSWGDWIYYERSLLAALVLAGLCIYATLASPNPRPDDAAAVA